MARTMEMELRNRSVYWGFMSLLLVALCSSATMAIAAYNKSEFTSDDYCQPDHVQDLNATDWRFNNPGRWEMTCAYQAHITQGDFDGKATLLTWVNWWQWQQWCWWGKMSDSDYDYKIMYATQLGKYQHLSYTSGYFFSCNFTDLEYDTTYWYIIYGNDYYYLPRDQRFQFTTPPAPSQEATFKFGVIGDLGQTEISHKTLQHYNDLSKHGQTVLYLGDLSYADEYQEPVQCDQSRWDKWTQLIEFNAAYQPWIWTVGNHEQEFPKKCQGFTEPYVSFHKRFPTPYLASSSNQNFYSIRRGPAHIIVLESSYNGIGPVQIEQLSWLKETFKTQVDRTITPWLIVLMHCPWFSSNTAHYQEGWPMLAAYQRTLLDNKVDIVFAGHVHSYERFRSTRGHYDVDTNKVLHIYDKEAPAYIVVGDGGNTEGLAKCWLDKPSTQACNASSFGYGTLEIHDKYTATWEWYNYDIDYKVGDTVELLNKYNRLEDGHVSLDDHAGPDGLCSTAKQI